MKCLFILNNKLNATQIENQYLLMLAMLNFDHEVNLLFIGSAFSQWQQDPQLSKHLVALNMYGAKPYILSDHQLVPRKENPIPLNPAEFKLMKNKMDFIS